MVLVSSGNICGACWGGELNSWTGLHVIVSGVPNLRGSSGASSIGGSVVDMGLGGAHQFRWDGHVKYSCHLF